MKPHNPWRLLPHEIFFGLMLVTLCARLALATGPLSRYTLFYIAAIAANIACVWFTRAGNTPRSWRLGMLFYPVAMNVVYMNLKTSVPMLRPGYMDAALQHVDSLIIGTNLSVRLQPLVNPALTEFFSFCYILFFPYLLFSLVVHFIGDVELLKKFVIGLFTIYGIGFIGYSLVPGLGPFIAMADLFTVPLTGWWITHWNSEIVARGSNGVGVFPSLHCAVSSFLLFFDRRHKPWRFWLYLVPCIGLWISTIYLRYHYFIDIVCGFALAAFGLWLAGRYPRQTSPATTPGQS
jgi:membrane-associated phospholipid phosphatase